MMIISDFAMKHPKLAKFARGIKDGIVGLVQRIKDAGNEEEIIEEKPVEEKPVEEKPAEEKPAEEKPVEEKPIEEKPIDEKQNKDNEFKKYIRDIAENGIKQADQNRLKEFREARSKSQENNKDGFDR